MTPREMREIVIRSAPIELVKLLKLAGLAGTGGEAKIMVAEGLVRINGRVETAKRKKIGAGDIVACGDDRVVVRVVTGSG
ncbi:MAG: hypothetical protein Kow0089_17440 [Desulfobulbaceae bacterium]